ncbi:MAG: hypothetical protein KDA96_25395, partial [Planctomycetaceae bacterium]|nr:hypothetical protein [Planctomycetaceae bacterium]
MKKRTSSAAGRKAYPAKDRVAKEFAQIKSLGIPAKRLLWSYCLRAGRKELREAAMACCAEYLAGILGKRCRIVIEDSKFNREYLQHFILRIPSPTPDLLRKLDQGMAACCKERNVKYNFVGYIEEDYELDSMTTLGALLRGGKPKSESIGDLDCRELRFDGLYYHHLGGGGDYLRFYPNGEFVSAAVSGNETIKDVARWLRREHKYSPVGTFTLKVKSLRGEYF